MEPTGDDTHESAHMTDVTTWSEVASKRFLGSYGLPVNREVEVSDPQAAGVAAAEIGFPVVVKLCGDAISHKTERGLVRLGIANRHGAEQAAAELLAAARPEDGPLTVLVGEMVRSNRELIVGVNVQPPFGPVVMVGFGGILAEAIEDVAFRLLPVTEPDVEGMIDDLATQALLEEFRGEPAVDRHALVKAVTDVGRAALAIPDLVSIDVNPLLIRDGQPVAVDALVVTEGSLASGAAL